MSADRLQLQRLELKYHVSEDTALRIRDFVRCYLELDENGVDKPNFAYPIHSIYLDSPDLATYRHTINGNKNRLKLRMRYYDDSPTSPVFFEIKRRMNEAILKQRGGVRKEAVAWLLGGHLPDPVHLLNNSPKQLRALQNFCQLMTEMRAHPVAHVAYLREAWVSTYDNSVRVTMDRQVRVCPEFSANLSTEMGHYVKPFGNEVILELKFTGRFPNWFGDLVRVFGLQRGSAAKYADGIYTTGEAAFLWRMVEDTAVRTVQESPAPQQVRAPFEKVRPPRHQQGGTKGAHKRNPIFSDPKPVCIGNVADQ